MSPSDKSQNNNAELSVTDICRNEIIRQFNDLGIPVPPNSFGQFINLIPNEFILPVIGQMVDCVKDGTKPSIERKDQ